jgi:hypothetical protein
MKRFKPTTTANDAAYGHAAQKSIPNFRFSGVLSQNGKTIRKFTKLSRQHCTIENVYTSKKNILFKTICYEQGTIVHVWLWCQG